MDQGWYLLNCGVQKVVLSAESSLMLQMFAYPVVTLGKMIESSFTFSFDDYKCYMHKGNRRVEMFRKGRTFVLRRRRKWLKDKVQMVAPIEEVVSGEMEIDDDGEGAEDARMEPRADEPGDVPPPPPRPREVRPSAMRPGAEIVRGVSWSEVATVPKRKLHRALDLSLSWNSEEDIWKGRKKSNGTKRKRRRVKRNNHNATHRCTCMDGMTRARRT